VYPQSICNCGDLDQGEVFVAETSALGFCPCKGLLVELEDVLGEFEFIGPKEVVLVEFKVIQAFLHKLEAGRERGWVGGKRRERNKWVFGALSDDAEVFREGGGHGVDFLRCLLICKDGSGWDCVGDVVLEGIHARRG